MEPRRIQRGKEYTMTPSQIVSTMLMFRDQAHILHLNTKSYARHKALDDLYSGMQSLTDEVAEIVLGYIAPSRLVGVTFTVDNSHTEESLVDAILDFSRQLESYAAANRYIQLQNVSAEIEGLAAKVKYFFTLS